MKNKKSSIVILIILLALLLIVAILLKLIKINNDGIAQKVDPSQYITNPYIEEEFELENTAIKEPSKFFTVQDIISEYLNNISIEKVSSISVVDQEENSLSEQQKNERIYSKLSSEYINKNNITVQNVKQYVYQHEGRLVFYPIAMNGKQEDNMINYSVYGRMRDITTGNFKEIYIKVITDTKNNTFAIEPMEDEKITSLQQIDLNITIKSIEKNDYNSFSYKKVSSKDLLDKYIGTYRVYTILAPEIAYSYLDEDYKNKRFETFENYKIYLEENKNYSIKLEKFQVEKKDGYKQYTCIDKNGNYYIIKETATMQYTLILDNHTIDLPEFTEKYDSVDASDKVAMNIEKIKDAINTKDYKYVYSKLDDNFKQNKFGTQEKFEEYIKQNLFEINNFNYLSAEEANNLYILNVKVTDANGKNTETKNISYVVKLLEGSDFVTSFNIK